jgi:hypothetical protein
LSGLESAVAVPKEYASVSHDVKTAVAVKIPHHKVEGARTFSTGIVLRGLEGAVAVSQEDIHRARTEIDSANHGEVKVAVAVKVPHCYGVGLVVPTA